MLYTAKDLEALLAEKGSANVLPANAKLTPMARDLLQEFKRKGNFGKSTAQAPREFKVPPTPVLPDETYYWIPGTDPQTPEEIQAFFMSEPIEALKRKICEIGQRIWQRNYVDGNGGNITVRVGDNLVLCTPTLVSKGFMKPEGMCLVNLDGKQLAGTRPSTSEVNTHLAIMKNEPAAKSCVHAHPPHATAYAVAGVKPPPCVIPEPEVFLGEVGLASYQTPGTPENAEEVGALAKHHQSILMQNHGVICWGKNLEDAYWKMENTEAYAQTVVISRNIGEGPQAYGSDKLQELLAIRKKLGMPDHRTEMKECELCDLGEISVNTSAQPNTCPTPLRTGGGTGQASAESDGPEDRNTEALIQHVTDMIMDELERA